MRKTYVIYSVAAALILASWFGNVGYNRYYRLPEGRFLQHHIEATDTPSVAFDLLYVANKDDKRTIQSIQVAELPTLQFYPVQEHQELNRQTIYKFTGFYASDPDRQTALPPLTIHAVTVTYRDGKTRMMDVGGIIVYRNAYPPRGGESPVGFSSGGGSTDNTGFNTVRASRPAVLTGTTSTWLSVLGTAFHFDVKWMGAVVDANGPHESEAVYPMELAKGDSLRTNYGFDFQDGNPQATDVFNVLLTQTFEEAGGRRSSYPIFANYLPYFTESQMRHFVRAQKGGDA